MEEMEKGEGAKRKSVPRYRRLTIKEKCQLIHDFKNGLRKTDLAKKYNITITSVTNILIKEEKYMTAGKMKNSSKRARLDSGQHPQMERTLVDWIKQKRSQGISLSGPLIREKALLLNNELIKIQQEARNKKIKVEIQSESDTFIDEETEKRVVEKIIEGNKKEQAEENDHQPRPKSKKFSASVGWFTKFKVRHEISYTGKTFSADPEGAENAQSEARKLIIENDYDEAELDQKSLSSKNLAFVTDTRPSGFQVSKERITVMNWANTTGSNNIPLLVIEKSAKPRCFKNEESPAVHYRNQSSAWMNEKWDGEEDNIPTSQELSDRGILKNVLNSKAVESSMDNVSRSMKVEEINISAETIEQDETQLDGDSSEFYQNKEEQAEEAYKCFSTFRRWYAKNCKSSESDFEFLNHIQEQVESTYYSIRYGN